MSKELEEAQRVQFTEECGCNACYSDCPDQCENGPYWHARAQSAEARLLEVKGVRDEMARHLWGLLGLLERMGSVGTVTNEAREALALLNQPLP